MDELRTFTIAQACSRQPCQKCNYGFGMVDDGDVFRPRYDPGAAAIEAPERLVWECRRCGFWYASETADAGGVALIPEDGYIAVKG